MECDAQGTNGAPVDAEVLPDDEPDAAEGGVRARSDGVSAVADEAGFSGEDAPEDHGGDVAVEGVAAEGVAADVVTSGDPEDGDPEDGDPEDGDTPVGPAGEPLGMTNPGAPVDADTPSRQGGAAVSAVPDVARSRSGRVGPTRLLNDDLPLLLVLLGSLWFAITFATLVVRRHNEFGSFDYDLGIYDQGIWLLGHGRQFLTVRGLRFLGHHWNPATFIFVPFYRLGAGPNLINATQAVGLAAGAIPAYFGTRKVTGNSWIGVAVAFAYLAHPSTGWLANELFHPESMAVPFVLAAWAFAEHEKWRWYAGFVIASLLWKEDVALAVAFLGLVVVWRKDRKIALMTFFGSILYFLVATKLIIPQILGRSAFYEELFGPLGSTTTDLAKNAVLHPDLYMRVLREHQAETYADSILRPFGYVSLLSPTSLLIGLPQFLFNVLSALNFIWNPRYHYVSMPLVSGTVAAAKAIAGRTRTVFRWGAVLIMVLFAFGVRNQGVGPWSNKYDDGYWPLQSQSLTPVYERALAVVPDDPNATTSSPYFLTPHLTHRYEAYTFPNPWRVSYWAVHGENARSGDRVKYVVMNEAVLGTEDLATYNTEVVASGQFTEIFREGTVVVWKRTSAAGTTAAVGGTGAAATTVPVPSGSAPVTSVASTTAPPVVLTAPTVAPADGPTVPPVPAAVTVPESADDVPFESGLPVITEP